MYWRMTSLFFSVLMLTGCVGLRVTQKDVGSATYVRWGQQDIRDFNAAKTGGDFEVSLGAVRVDQPEILKPEQWNEIITNYLGAGLAGSVLDSLHEDPTNGGDISVEEIRSRIAEILKDRKEGSPAPSDPADDAPRADDWPDWPAGETRYHIYPENNSAPVEKGLWKPDSDSRPGKPVLLLPAHMSKVGVAKLTIGGQDITDDVRKYPDNPPRPILGNGLRLHFNAPAVGSSVPVVATLEDGSEWTATIVNGSKRQDPLAFTQTKEADNDDGGSGGPADGQTGGAGDNDGGGTGDDIGDTGDPAGDSGPGDGGTGQSDPIPALGSWSPPVVQLPAWMEGKVRDVRVGKAYNMTHLGGLRYTGPPMTDPIWDGPWEAYPMTGARVHLKDGRTVDSFVRHIKQPYSPMRWYDISFTPPKEATK